jgi:hypothetical protein
MPGYPNSCPRIGRDGTNLLLILLSNNGLLAHITPPPSQCHLCLPSPLRSRLLQRTLQIMHLPSGGVLLFNRGIAPSRRVGPMVAVVVALSPRLEPMPVRVQGRGIGDECRSEDLTGRPGDAIDFGVTRAEGPGNAQRGDQHDY